MRIKYRAFSSLTVDIVDLISCEWHCAPDCPSAVLYDVMHCTIGIHTHLICRKSVHVYTIYMLKLFLQAAHNWVVAAADAAGRTALRTCDAKSKVPFMLWMLGACLRIFMFFFFLYFLYVSFICFYSLFGILISKAAAAVAVALRSASIVCVCVCVGRMEQRRKYILRGVQSSGVHLQAGP